MSLKNQIIKIILFVLFFSAINLAQTADSLEYPQSLNDSGFVMQKSPTGAMLRSCIIPGWGQIYNESYWKAPLIWGVSAWFIYWWIDRNDSYKFYKNLYKDSFTDSFPEGDDRYRVVRDSFRDSRDLFAVYLGLTYFLNFIDAYVDAHLFDFDVVFNNYTKKPELRLKLSL